MTGAMALAATPGLLASGTELKPYDISPGLLGFLVVLAIVVAMVLLLVSMTGKIRRLKHRAELDEQAEAERVAPPADGGAGGE